VASRTQAYSENVPGPWFVDDRCIDCDVCRQLATSIFQAADDHSFVGRQPATPAEQRDALRALLSCPTGAIGTSDHAGLSEVREQFPEPVADGVFYNGFTSERSFGSHSYFIQHPSGNWLVDSPRYLEPLAKKMDARGGLAYIFLSHADDVADAAKYAQRFGAKRIIHRRELKAQPNAEIVIEGTDPVKFESDFVVVPTPGHTAGHCVLHYHDRFLFTGDHLWWDRDTRTLDASRRYCWWSWPEQLKSLERLQSLKFEWVLPGHGERVHLLGQEMQRQVADLVARESASSATAS
jgi:glyoxylase-like metal-dependent hydrolase (beta-lactamase superfamily II)/ferredoxin